jgi:hypothetical protein
MFYQSLPKLNSGTGITRYTYGEEKKLRIYVPWEDAEILDFLRSINPEYLNNTDFRVNRADSPDSYLGFYEIIRKERAAPTGGPGTADA